MFNLKFLQTRKWFTMVELIVVLTVLIILSTLGMISANYTSPEDLTDRYVFAVSDRINEIYSKVILWKQILPWTTYIKLSCDSTITPKNMFAYACSWASCTQVLFPVSWYGGWQLDNTEQKKWSLTRCAKKISWVTTNVPKFYVYIVNSFPYATYIKTVDNGVFAGEWIDSAVFGAGAWSYEKLTEIILK